MTTTSTDDTQIRAVPRPLCALCGKPGELIHLEQPDRLFSAPGKWNSKQCPDPRCRLVWLDPMPMTEDIGKAYAQYYTHKAPAYAAPAPKKGIRAVYQWLKRGYLANHYGYEFGPARPSALAGKLFCLIPRQRYNVDREVRFLHWTPHARVLDLGCGSGEWLLWMRHYGWEVEGLDFDEKAINAGKQEALDLRLGSLEQQDYPAHSFDAVTMSHVIEHVPDPVGTLKECARILKPGGQLVMFTPNSASLGHRRLKQDWRGLEPPRHLHLFCPGSMRSLLDRAGFTSARVQTHNSLHIWKETFHLWSLSRGSRNPLANLAASAAPRLFTAAEALLLLADSDAGEWLCARARTPSPSPG